MVNPMVVDLPPLRARPANLFTDVAVDISAQFKDDTADRTARGASFMYVGQIQPKVVPYWCGVDDDKSTTNLVFNKDGKAAAILSYAWFQCSGLSGDLGWMPPFVDSTFELLISHALAFAATTIMLPPEHMSVAESATDVGNGSTMLDALARVEKGLADKASNAEGVIFIPIRNLANLVSLQAIALGDGGFRTPAGHRVVADAGHQGDNTIYGTTQLGYALQTPVPSEELNSPVAQFNRVHNDIRWMAETYGLVVFNPAHTVKSTLTGASA
jgi:hypothetical protein